jgi:hypothetical protein
MHPMQGKISAFTCGGVTSSKTPSAGSPSHAPSFGGRVEILVSSSVLPDGPVHIAQPAQITANKGDALGRGDVREVVAHFAPTFLPAPSSSKLHGVPMMLSFIGTKHLKRRRRKDRKRDLPGVSDERRRTHSSRRFISSHKGRRRRISRPSLVARGRNRNYLTREMPGKRRGGWRLRRSWRSGGPERGTAGSVRPWPFPTGGSGSSN